MSTSVKGSGFEALGERLGHRFGNIDLLRQAMTHRSYAASNNERLEFLGDAIVDLLVGEALFQRFPQLSEGDLSRLRASLVRKETLAELARSFGFGDYLQLGSGELKSGGAERDSILGDALEAVIAAIYLDAGMDVVRARVLEWFSGKLDDLDTGSGKDAKTRLQELLQARKLSLPRYEVRAVKGPAHNQNFDVLAHVAGLEAPVAGRGKTRRAAEQAAAQEALKKLGES